MKKCEEGLSAALGSVDLFPRVLARKSFHAGVGVDYMIDEVCAVVYHLGLRVVRCSARIDRLVDDPDYRVGHHHLGLGEANGYLF